MLLLRQTWRRGDPAQPYAEDSTAPSPPPPPGARCLDIDCQSGCRTRLQVGPNFPDNNMLGAALWTGGSYARKFAKSCHLPAGSAGQLGWTRGAALYCGKLICETDATRRWSSFASSGLAAIRSISGDCHHNVARAGLRSRLSLTSVSSCCLVTARYGETELCRELATGAAGTGRLRPRQPRVSRLSVAKLGCCRAQADSDNNSDNSIDNNSTTTTVS